MSAISLHDPDQIATKGDLPELRAEFKADLAGLRGTLTNWMLTLLVAMIAAMIGVGFLS